MTQTHPNDIYGDLSKRDPKDGSPLIPAATVVLLRDSSSGGYEVLMLQKNVNISFGGMWVFPGGKIDQQDYQEDAQLQTAATIAAVRETHEETGLAVSAEQFIWFAHWTPPASAPKRYATWFFVANANESSAVQVDGQEILNHRWISPVDAIAHHAKGEIDLAPPTWLTLHYLSQFNNVSSALQHFADTKAKIYETRVVKSNTGLRVALWHGDAGYDSWNADVAGARHRLLLAKDGFVFENTVESDY